MYKTIKYILNSMWKTSTTIPDYSQKDYVSINEDEKGLFAHYIDEGSSEDPFVFRTLRLDNAWVEALSRISEEENFSFIHLIQSEKGKPSLSRSLAYAALCCLTILAFAVFLFLLAEHIFSSYSILKKISSVLVPIFLIAIIFHLINANEKQMSKRFKRTLPLYHETYSPKYNAMVYKPIQHSADYIYDELHQLQKIRTQPVFQSINKGLIFVLSLCLCAALIVFLLPDYTFASFDIRLAHTIYEGKDEFAIADLLQKRQAEDSKNMLLDYITEQNVYDDDVRNIGNAVCLLTDEGFFSAVQQQELLDQLMTATISHAGSLDPDTYFLFLSRCSDAFLDDYPILYSENARGEMSTQQLAALKRIYQDWEVGKLLVYWRALYQKGYTNTAHSLLNETAPALSIDDLGTIADNSANDTERELFFQAFVSRFTSVDDVLKYLETAAMYGIKASDIAPDGIPIDLNLSHCIAESEAVDVLPDSVKGLLPLVRIEDKENFGPETEHTEANSEYFTIKLDTAVYDALPEHKRPQSQEQVLLYLLYDEQYEPHGALRIKSAYHFDAYTTYSLVQRISLYNASSGELICHFYETENAPRSYLTDYHDISGDVPQSLMSKDPEGAAFLDAINLSSALKQMEYYAFGKKTDPQWTKTHQSLVLEMLSDIP